MASNLIGEFIKQNRQADDSPPGGRSSMDILSSRECEVLKLIAEGGNNREIASVLRISPQTVKTHRMNIMKKLNIHKVNDWYPTPLKTVLGDMTVVF
jgi:DNA-binding NarL/FixJ family response regulator